MKMASSEPINMYEVLDGHAEQTTRSVPPVADMPLPPISEGSILNDKDYHTCELRQHHQQLYRMNVYLCGVGSSSKDRRKRRGQHRKSRYQTGPSPDIRRRRVYKIA